MKVERTRNKNDHYWNIACFCGFKTSGNDARGYNLKYLLGEVYLSPKSLPLYKLLYKLSYKLL